MQKDKVATPLEPFTPEEEAALFDKLDVLSIPALEHYIGAAQNSLRNMGLDPSWRPRVAVGLQRAELVLVREAAAEALRAESPPAEEPAPVKPKARSRKKAVAAAEATPEAADASAEANAETEAEVEAEAPDDAE
jgi:hypothetical protein